MDFGVVLPNLGGTADPGALLHLARRVEQLGYNSLWVSDHVVLPVRVESRYPYSPAGTLGLQPEEDLLEPFTTLTFLAGATQRVRLCISVQVLPYRHPVLNAKMVATLDVLSGGRFIFGVGVGWIKEEFDALGADYNNRGPVTDEHLKIYKALCSQEELSYQGVHYQVEGIKFFPKPIQMPHPPIWVGGNSRRALLRAATLGDGWHGVRLRPTELGELRNRLMRLRDENSLPWEGFDVSLRTSMVITDVPAPEGRTPMTGTAQQVLDDVAQYEGSGVDHMVLGPRARNLGETQLAVERFADEVMARL